MAKITSEQRDAVLRHLNDGLSVRKIRDITGVSKSYVHKIKKANGIEFSAKNSGRPAKLSPQDKRFCVYKVTRGRIDNAVVVTKTLREEVGVTCSPNTVRSALKEAGLGSIEKPKKPLLSEANRRKRLAFAKKYQHWTTDDWRRVIWSDESKINRFCLDGRKWTWIRDGEQLQNRHCKLSVKHGGGNIKVWSCITYHGVGWLTMIDEILDKELYLKILQEDLMKTIADYGMDENELIFQHDNDPKHTAKVVVEWLKKQKFLTMIWPPQSPDLNPIENLWALLKRRLGDFETAPKGMNELFERVGKVWYEITMEECQKVIDSMPKRCQAVIKAKGKWIDY